MLADSSRATLLDRVASTDPPRSRTVGRLDLRFGAGARRGGQRRRVAQDPPDLAAAAQRRDRAAELRWSPRTGRGRVRGRTRGGSPIRASWRSLPPARAAGRADRQHPDDRRARSRRRAGATPRAEHRAAPRTPALARPDRGARPARAGGPHLDRRDHARRPSAQPTLEHSRPGALRVRADRRGLPRSRQSSCATAQGTSWSRATTTGRAPAASTARWCPRSSGCVP